MHAAAEPDTRCVPLRFGNSVPSLDRMWRAQGATNPSSLGAASGEAERSDRRIRPGSLAVDAAGEKVDAPRHVGGDEPFEAG